MAAPTACQDVQRRTPPARRIELDLYSTAPKRQPSRRLGRRVLTRVVSICALGRPRSRSLTRRARAAAAPRRARGRGRAGGAPPTSAGHTFVSAVERRHSPAGGPVAVWPLDGQRRGGGGRSLPAGRAAGGREVDAGGDRACVRERLDAERHLLVAEDAAAGDHAHAGEHVDAGGQREVRRRRVVKGRLPARLLGAARVHAALGGQAVEVAHVADGRGHDQCPQAPHR